MATITLVCLSINAQVGINTLNVQGVFNIDTKGNNQTTGTPTAAQMSDDIVVDKNATQGINMTVGGKADVNSSALLTLLDSNKALLLNSVPLKSITDIVTIPNPRAGIFVLNTATDGVYPENVVPGYYYFNGIVWVKLQYGTPLSELSQSALRTNCISIDVPGLDNAVSPMQSALLDFETIKIKEKGTYLFSLRLYGSAKPNAAGNGAPAFARTITYLYMMKNGSTKVGSMEINVPMYGGGGVAFTHTANMQAVLEKDDVVTFRWGNYTNWYRWELISQSTLRANRTSLIYWKI